MDRLIREYYTWMTKILGYIYDNNNNNDHDNINNNDNNNYKKKSVTKALNIELDILISKTLTKEYN